MDYTPIIKKICYWKNYKGKGDIYRKTHDFDCILTGGNLFADTIFSLWLPLRYTLDYYASKKWADWKKYETELLRPKHMGLKDCTEFLEDIGDNMKIFLPKHTLTKNLIDLFRIGQTRANVMILPYRNWNTARAGKPYWEYMPHFLFDLLNTNDAVFLAAVTKWVEKERLTVFFEEGIIDKEHIKDLAGTGKVWNHSPSELIVPALIENYIAVLEERRLLPDTVSEIDKR